MEGKGRSPLWKTFSSRSSDAQLQRREGLQPGAARGKGDMSKGEPGLLVESEKESAWRSGPQVGGLGGEISEKKQMEEEATQKGFLIFLGNRKEN